LTVFKKREDKSGGGEDREKMMNRLPFIVKPSTIFEKAIKPSEKQDECIAAQLLTPKRL
jgi:hypothetical protein